MIKLGHALLKAIVWSAGVNYLLTWSLVYWFLADGSLIRDNPACLSDAVGPLRFWVCGGDDLAASLSLLVNAALSVTVWAPVFVALAAADPAYWVIAGPIVAINLLGVAAAITVAFRLLLFAIRAVRRQPVIGAKPAGPG